MFRVLIADDEPIERLVVSKKIQAYFEGRLEVVMAENGSDAVEKFFDEQCRIAILDINMPGMDGLTAGEKIRERDGECSIIFLTAYDEFSFAKKAFSVRALDYLLKPGSDDELIAVLEEALSRAERENGRQPDEHGAGGASGTDKANTESADVSAERDGRDAEGKTGKGISGEDLAEMPAAGDNVRRQMAARAMSTYIHDRYQSDISLQDAADYMGYSEAYFCKIFKQCFDKNFTTYLTEYRIAAAKELLTDLDVSIKEICVQVGFRDSNYFTKVFKRMTGTTPSEYRICAVRKSVKL